MADQRSIKSYFGAPVKQLKRKAKPNPAIEAWLLGAKTKRHAMKRVHDAPVVVPTAGPSVSEPFQALPPLPELPQIDSSSDSDSE